MLKLENIWLEVGNGNGENKDILKGINLEFQKGKIYAITGPNGGGKTSIAKVIMGIYHQSEGNIVLEGEDISDLSVTERGPERYCLCFSTAPALQGTNSFRFNEYSTAGTG